MFSFCNFVSIICQVYLLFAVCMYSKYKEIYVVKEIKDSAYDVNWILVNGTALKRNYCLNVRSEFKVYRKMFSLYTRT